MSRTAPPPVTDDESAYSYQRPRKCVIGPLGDHRAVVDTNDVLRDICWMLIRETGWTQVQLAERVGISRTSMNSFMSGTSAAEGVLTGLCAVIDGDAIDVLSMHPLYADHARSIVRPKDRLFQRFNQALRIDQARRFVLGIEAAKSSRRLEAALKILSEFAGVDLSLDGSDDDETAGNSARKPPKLRRVKK